MTYPNSNFTLNGRAITGLTSPTYTCTLDTGPTSKSRQFAVTALGGTQTGVVAHTLSSPFTATIKLPEKPRSTGSVNPTTGIVTSIPLNTTSIIVRKGFTPVSGQAAVVGNARVDISIPAGAESLDRPNVKALLSVLVGLLDTYINDFDEMTATNIL